MSESFEDAMAEMRNVITDDCDKTYCAMYDDDCYACESAVLDRLQKAHDHEMEQLRRSRFREGYEAGQKSMDASHYLLKLRLQLLKFGDGSHENLSRLAYAIYPCPTGWGKESCEGLRDKLIELLGGVHDEPAPIPAIGCACDADCDCGHGDEASIAYDELGNERRKAVCRLRKFEPMIGSKPTEEASKLIRCITGKSDSHVACGNDLEETRDRLIHLLGGDEPLPNSSELFRTFAEPNLPKSAEVAKPESEDGGENCRITDELREWMDLVLTADDQAWDIADRIDEQFNRICWQQEAVLQHTIDTMVDERDKLRTMLTEQRDEARAKVLKLDNEVSKLQKKLNDARDSLNHAAENLTKALDEKDELQAKLDKLEKFDPDTSLAAFGDDNDELRKLLSRAAKLLDNAEQDRDANYAYWMDCKAKVVQANTTIDELHAKLDEYKSLFERYRDSYVQYVGEYNVLQRALRRIAKRAGVPDEVDLSECDNALLHKLTIERIDSMHEYIGALEWQRDRQKKSLDKYENADTPEEIVRDIHLGIATDSQAIERIRALNG